MAERITITIETGSAAFVDYPASEIARILETLAARIRNDGPPVSGHKLRDLNGNTVGAFTIEADDGN